MLLFLLEFTEQTEDVSKEQQIDASNDEDIRRQRALGGWMKSNETVEAEPDQRRQHAAAGSMPRARRQNGEKVVHEKGRRGPGRKNDDRDPNEIQARGNQGKPRKVRPSARGRGARNDDRHEQRVENKCHQRGFGHEGEGGATLGVEENNENGGNQKAERAQGRDLRLPHFSSYR